MGSGNKEWKNRDGCRYNPMMWDWDNHRRPTKGFKIQCHPPFGCEFLSSSVATRLGWNSRLAYFSHATSAECSFRADESCVTRSRNAGVHDSHLLYIHTRPLITFLLGLRAPYAIPLAHWDGRGRAMRQQLHRAHATFKRILDTF